MLTDRWSADDYATLLKPAAEWRPYPPAADRAAWQALAAQGSNPGRAAWLIAEAERLLAEPWPQLTADMYMRCERDGDRGTYDSTQFARRKRLAVWCLAECFEGRGRFLPPLIDGLWSTCEEATWVVPPHCFARMTHWRDDLIANDPLPPVGERIVDLFAAETAATVALVTWLLRDELAGVSRFLVEHLVDAVDRRNWRILEQDEQPHWWAGHHNWSTWCACSSLTSALMLMEDRVRLGRFAHRLAGVIDRFIEHYTDDGACDEGPMYWSKAGGQMLTFLELLHQRSDSAIAIWDQVSKLQAIAQYIHTAHMAGPWFDNVADAPPRGCFDYHSLYRGAERLGRGDLQRMALFAQQNFGQEPRPTPLHPQQCGGWLATWLHELFWMPADPPAITAVDHREEDWLADRQVVIMRERGRPEGLVVAAKGGHNGECHNHNDVGQVTIVLDGRPVVVDVGPSAYTRDTFKRECRYQLWNIRSLGHDVPCIDGIEQEAGGEFAARDVVFSAEGERRFALELAGAYPQEAGIASLRRELVLGDAAELRWTDTVRMADDAEHDWQLPLHVWPEPQLPEPGRILLAGGGDRLLELRYDPEWLSATVERIASDDTRMLNAWGGELHRIDLGGRFAGETAFDLRFAVVPG